MRSPSGLQACGHLALARGQGAPFCHRRCSMCSRAGTDAAVPTSSATSAPLAELAAPCSRPGHCQGLLAPRAAHARGRGGSTKRRRLLQACPTRYTGTRVNFYKDRIEQKKTPPCSRVCDLGCEWRPIGDGMGSI